VQIPEIRGNNPLHERYAGTYVYRPDKGSIKTLTLRADGTFTETWSLGQLDGHWETHGDGLVVGNGFGFAWARQYRVGIKPRYGCDGQAYEVIADVDR
jgi:hypothetical protein